MKYGIYFAYWTKEWFADYKKYMDKVSLNGCLIFYLNFIEEVRGASVFESDWIQR